MPVYCKMDLSPAEQKVAGLKREITTLEWEINELASQMGPIRHTPGYVHPAHWISRGTGKPASTRFPDAFTALSGIWRS